MSTVNAAALAGFLIVLLVIVMMLKSYERT
jgi:hypothetical protein